MKNSLLLLFFYVSIILNAQEEIQDKKEYIVFLHSDSLNFREESNAAVIVSDRDSVMQLKELFFLEENSEAEFLCGYDY